MDFVDKPNYLRDPEESSVRSATYDGRMLHAGHETQSATAQGSQDHEAESLDSAPSTQFASSGPKPPVGTGFHEHALTASERGFGKHPPSTARAGKVVDINIDHLVEGTALTPPVVTLIRALQKKHLRVGSSPAGLKQLEQVFAEPSNAAQLMSLTHVHDAQHLLPWLYQHETAVIPTREHQADGSLANRPADEMVASMSGFLHDHHGAHALIDEAGTGRFGLVAQVAHEMAAQHPDERGQWGAYISAAPGGLKTPKVSHTMGALRDAGASAVLEGYTAGINPWNKEDARLHQADTSLHLLHKYFAHPGFAMGVDPKRVGLPNDHSKALHRLFLERLQAKEKRTHHALPGVETGSWISRLDGDEHADNAELGTLLSGL